MDEPRTCGEGLAQRSALANLVQCERDLAELLKTWGEEDQAMLVVSKESP